jgi:cytoskeletal protein RodZ
MFVSQIGIILREVRIANNEILNDMACNLNISITLLSSIESGKCLPPSSFIDQFITTYSDSFKGNENLLDLVKQGVSDKSVFKKNVLNTFFPKNQNTSETEVNVWLEHLKKNKV